MGNIFSFCTDENNDEKKKLLPKNNNYLKYNNNNYKICKYCKKHSDCIMIKKGIEYDNCSICETFIPENLRISEKSLG